MKTIPLRGRRVGATAATVLCLPAAIGGCDLAEIGSGLLGRLPISALGFHRRDWFLADCVCTRVELSTGSPV